MEILQIIGATLLSLLILFLLTKLMGNKQISQMTTFDYITGITIGSIAAEMATDLEGGILPETVAMIVYGLIAVLISVLTSKSISCRKYLTGKPLVLMENGNIYRNRLKKAKMDVDDFLAMCRLAGYFDLSQVETAILEHNGNVSFLPKAKFRPANPEDFSLEPQSENIYVDIIMDGRIIYDNLSNINKSPQWLMNSLKGMGFKDEKDILLLSADTDGKLLVFPIANK